MNSKKLTSVKVEKDLLEKFKIECVKRKFSFQKLADRSIYLYLTDEEYRKTLHNQIDISID
jgi:hypothetical protein